MEEAAHHLDQLTPVAFVIVVALAGGMVMSHLKLPAVVGYILAGVVLGPAGFGLVENRDLIQFMAELGVLLLLFLVGMELSLEGLKAVWKMALGTFAVQQISSLLIAAGLGLLLDWELSRTLLIAFVLSLSSTAVAVKMLEDLGRVDDRAGRITVGVLVGQDLAVVPMMLILAAFAATGGGEGATFNWWGLVKAAFSIIFLAALIAVLLRAGRVRLPFSRIIEASRDLKSVAGLGFCFAAAALSGVLGLSAAYGAFLAGLVIGNSNLRETMLHTIEPLQAVLLMVFFLSIGLLIDFEHLRANWILVAVLVLMVIGVKTAINIGALRALGESWPNAILPGIVLAQLGEFAFILGALGYSLGAVDEDSYRLIVSVTVLTLILSPVWLVTSRRLQRFSLLGVTSGRELFRLMVTNEFRPLSALGSSLWEGGKAGLARLGGARRSSRKDSHPSEDPGDDKGGQREAREDDRA